ARDDFEAHLQSQAAKLREELNYLYNQMHRSVRGAVQTPDTSSTLEAELLERERKLLEITRQLQHRTGGGNKAQQEDLFSLTQLQNALDAQRALGEYTTSEEELVEV